MSGIVIDPKLIREVLEEDRFCKFVGKIDTNYGSVYEQIRDNLGVPDNVQFRLTINPERTYEVHVCEVHVWLTDKGLRKTLVHRRKMMLSVRPFRYWVNTVLLSLFIGIVTGLLLLVCGLFADMITTNVDVSYGRIWWIGIVAGFVLMFLCRFIKRLYLLYRPWPAERQFNQ